MMETILTRCRLCAALFALTFPLSAIAGAQSVYTITDLGTLGGEDSIAVSMNRFGDIAGTANVPGGDFHAFLADANTDRKSVV